MSTSSTKTRWLEAWQQLFRALEIDEKYAYKFVKQEININRLLDLTEQDLQELFPTRGPLIALRGYISRRKSSSVYSPANNTPAPGNSWIPISYNDLSEVEFLKTGAFGMIWTASLRISLHEKSDHISVACKFPQQRLGRDNWAELTALTNIPPHRNIIRFIGLCTDFHCNGRKDAALISEYCAGGSLVQELAHDRGYATLLRLTLGMTEAILHCHRNDYIHRDIAIRNFVLSPHRDVVLIDFGLSRPLDSNNMYTPLDRSPVSLPLRWSAPETVIFPSTSTKRSDVWMLGISFWELISGAEPFDQFDIPQQDLPNKLRHLMQSEKKPVPLDFSKTGCPPEFRSLIEDCCRYEPVDRLIVEEVKWKLESIRKEYESKINIEHGVGRRYTTVCRDGILTQPLVLSPRPFNPVPPKSMDSSQHSFITKPVVTRSRTKSMPTFDGPEGLTESAVQKANTPRHQRSATETSLGVRFNKEERDTLLNDLEQHERQKSHVEELRRQSDLVRRKSDKERAQRIKAEETQKLEQSLQWSLSTPIPPDSTPQIDDSAAGIICELREDRDQKESAVGLQEYREQKESTAGLQGDLEQKESAAEKTKTNHSRSRKNALLSAPPAFPPEDPTNSPSKKHSRRKSISSRRTNSSSRRGSSRRAKSKSADYKSRSKNRKSKSTKNSHRRLKTPILDKTMKSICQFIDTLEFTREIVVQIVCCNVFKTGKYYCNVTLFDRGEGRIGNKCTTQRKRSIKKSVKWNEQFEWNLRDDDVVNSIHISIYDETDSLVAISKIPLKHIVDRFSGNVKLVGGGKNMKASLSLTVFYRDDVEYS